MAYKINSKELYEEVEFKGANEFLFAFKNSKIKIKKRTVNDQISLYDITSFLEDDLEIYSDYFRQDTFMIGFNIKGDSGFYSKNLSLNIASNTASIYFAKELFNTKATCLKGENRAVGIILNPNIVQNFLPKEQAKVLKLAPIQNKSALYLSQIINGDFNDDLSEFFFQSRVFDIIHAELSSINRGDKKEPISLSEFDLCALEKAKILLSQADKIPSISELARAVHLNSFKLKIGFKQLFKQTPCEFARAQKMLRAKELLQNSDMNIFEVAKALGFKHQSHFTKMFYDEFKILPKDFIKSSVKYFI
ncbi:helix-turn-helix domain-containing protein [Campylobacter sp.]|uniref:helix-turn-helix domain-containing protein n=1 Tax=Campylobacter sp. TaxID=205 RepID=UPI0026FF7B04|nr:AraC family transcriptional regulator [Campylobacter sp.]